MSNTPIDEQLFNHISSLLPSAEWKLWYDVFHDDDAKGRNQVIIRSTGGVEDPLIGEPGFDIIVYGNNDNGAGPKAKLNEVSKYLLENHKFGDIIHTRIVSGVRPLNVLSNNRYGYTMTISLLTNRTESQ